MGVDVFSAGQTADGEPGVEAIRYEDPALGIYKKLLIKDNRLHGVILVGDASDDRKYLEWLRQGADLSPHRRHLLFPPPEEDHGLELAQMPDSETICGCMGVSKGDILRAIHEHGVSTLEQLKDRTRASAAAAVVPAPANGC